MIIVISYRTIICNMKWWNTQEINGATTYDFGGTDNNPSKDSEHYGLWAFKRVWGTYLSEKIGEFDYVLNQPLYQLIEQVKPRLTKAKIKLSRKLKRK